MLQLATKIHHIPEAALVTNIRDRDPTQTITLRKRFLVDVNRRFRSLRSAIRKKIIDEDYLNQPIITLEDYEYEYADRKINGFIEWLEQQETLNILETVPGPGLGVGQLGEEVPWTNTYIQSGYQKGIRNARADLRREGMEIPSFTPLPGQDEIAVAFNQPFHSGRVSLVYARAFNGMKGVTAQMNTHLSHVLAKGMAEGLGIVEIANNMDSKINTFKNRVRLIARTEIVYAHNTATLNEFEAIEGFTGEEILSRWFTARDERVRAHHAARHNVVYTRKMAESLIGEPNCRCSLLPHITSIHGKVKPGERYRENAPT